MLAGSIVASVVTGGNSTRKTIRWPYQSLFRRYELYLFTISRRKINEQK